MDRAHDVVSLTERAALAVRTANAGVAQHLFVRVWKSNTSNRVYLSHNHSF